MLALAEENGMKTLALPATGTGIAGFSTDRCAEIMLEEVRKHIEGGTALTDVYFVLFDAATAETFRSTWTKMQER